MCSYIGDNPFLKFNKRHSLYFTWCQLHFVVFYLYRPGEYFKRKLPISNQDYVFAFVTL